LWFRGQKVDKPLLSKVHREVLALEGASGSIRSAREVVEGRLRYIERSQYHRYKSLAWPILSPAERAPWLIVVSMQHHGIPTRLLDWTESFACALFFALENAREGDTPVLYAFEPEALNAYSLDDEQCLVYVPEGLEQTRIDVRAYHPLGVRSPSQSPLVPLAIVAPMSNPRMLAQQARFTLMGDSFTPLEEYLAETGLLLKVSLPPPAWPEAWEFLSLTGTTRYSLFPDLHGLAQDFGDTAAKTLAAVARLAADNESGELRRRYDAKEPPFDQAPLPPVRGSRRRD
jgi:hypothetical protein